MNCKALTLSALIIIASCTIKAQRTALKFKLPVYSRAKYCLNSDWKFQKEDTVRAEKTEFNDSKWPTKSR